MLTVATIDARATVRCRAEMRIGHGDATRRIAACCRSATAQRTPVGTGASPDPNLNLNPNPSPNPPPPEP
jgi:hypothetical protein